MAARRLGRSRPVFDQPERRELRDPRVAARDRRLRGPELLLQAADAPRPLVEVAEELVHELAPAGREPQLVELLPAARDLAFLRVERLLLRGEERTPARNGPGAVVEIGGRTLDVPLEPRLEPPAQTASLAGVRVGDLARPPLDRERDLELVVGEHAATDEDLAEEAVPLLPLLLERSVELRRRERASLEQNVAQQYGTFRGRAPILARSGCERPQLAGVRIDHADRIPRVERGDEEVDPSSSRRRTVPIPGGMPAALAELDELLAYRLSCPRATFEALDEDEVVTLLLARFRLLVAYGWDWASALMLAADVELPAHETADLAPAVATPLVLQ